MWEAIKNFFAGMFSSKIEIDKPLELPRYDSKQLKRELEIEKKAKEDGLANIPPYTAKEVIGYEKTITNNLVQKITQAETKAKNEINSLSEEINHLDIENLKQSIEGFDKITSDEFNKRKGLVANFKYYEVKDVENINRIFQEFKVQNKLKREPRYPESKRFSYAVIGIIVLIEIFLNTGFFKEFTTSGILGGFFVAFSIAIVNVGLGWIYGDYIARYINHVSYFKKLLSLIGGLVFIAGIITTNFFAAHLRDAVTAVIASGGMPNEVNLIDVLNKMINEPLMLTTFGSIILIPIGIGFALTSLIKMYRADDPYPGYGALEREKRIKTAEHHSEIYEYLDDCRELMKARLREIRNLINMISNKFHTLQNYKGKLELYTENFNIYLKHVEAITDEIVNEYRSTNMKNRPEPKQFPKYYDKPYKLNYSHDVKFPLENINKLLAQVEIMQKQSKQLTEKTIKHIHKSYKEAINEFDDIRDIDLRKYLDDVD